MLSITSLFSYIEIRFSPKNITSKLQPLNAGVIKVFKVGYRRCFLQTVVSQAEPGVKTSDIVESVEII